MMRMTQRLLATVLFAACLPGCGAPVPEEQMASNGSRRMTKEVQASLLPADALHRLKDGNGRFVTGHSLQRNFPDEAYRTSSGQYPFAAILSCVDSRVGPELVFDQGLGEIFSARVAGNVVNDDILGSLEFATQVAGAKLILVVGHSACGAVKGACTKVELGHLTGLLGKIEPAVEAVKAKQAPDVDVKGPGFVDDVARENVRRMVRLLADSSPILRQLVSEGKLRLVGAFQDLPSGRVTFFE